MHSPRVMQGVITERHFAEAELAFPGIARFCASLREKPVTFLELVWLYEAAQRQAGGARR